MKSEQESLIAKRLARMEPPAPLVQKESVEKSPPPNPPATEPLKAAAPGSQSRLTRYLLLGMGMVFLFSLSGLYFVFASRIMPEKSPVLVTPPIAVGEASPQGDASAEAEADTEQEFVNWARSVSGKEDPFVPDLPAEPEEPVQPTAPRPPRLFVTVLGTITNEPRIALLEVVVGGEKKRLRAKESETIEGFVVEKIDKGSVTIRNAAEISNLTLGSTAPIR